MPTGWGASRNLGVVHQNQKSSADFQESYYIVSLYNLQNCDWLSALHGLVRVTLMEIPAAILCLVSSPGADQYNRVHNALPPFLGHQITSKNVHLNASSAWWERLKVRENHLRLSFKSPNTHLCASILRILNFTPSFLKIHSLAGGANESKPTSASSELRNTF